VYRSLRDLLRPAEHTRKQLSNQIPQAPENLDLAALRHHLSLRPTGFEIALLLAIQG
jgi:hypothetical protein